MAERDVAVILRALGRIEGQLDGIQTEQGRVSEYAGEISRRLHIVEDQQSRWRGWMAGVAAVVSIIVTLIATTFAQILV